MIAAALLTSACSDDKDPQVLPSLTPTPTAAPTLAVAIPASAKPETAQGAADFVEYWFATLDQAYQRGVPFPAELSDPACASCRNFSDVAADLSKGGTHFAGPSFEDLDAQSPPPENGKVLVTFTCALPERQEIDAQGKKVNTFPAEGKLVMTVLLQRQASSWLVRAMQTQS